MENSQIIKVEKDSNTFEECEQIEQKDDRFLQELHHFLSLLPKEIWDYICSFLDILDFQNLYNSSLFFRDLFLHKRIFIFFEPVLKIILPKIGSNAETPLNKFHQDCNARSLLVNCRATCKTWKSTIDKMACLWNEDKHKDTNLVYKLFSPNYTFKEDIDVEEFLEHFKNTHNSSLNPFPGKFVNLQVRLSEHSSPRLSRRISNLLETYGQHLSTCSIYIVFEARNPLQIHQKVVEWLNFMPNLQNLSVYYIFPLRPNVDQVHLNVELPKLNFLRNLVIKTFSPAVQDEHIHDWSWFERYNLSQLLYKHDNLEFLHVTIFNKNDVEILGRFISPLKTLAAQYNCKEDDVKLSEVFTMLSDKFSESLEDLTLTFRVRNKPSGHLQCIRDSFNGRLNLPNVKRMEIKIMSTYCLDFLLGAKDKLEELSITCVGWRQGFYGYSGFSEEERSEIGEIGNRQVIQYLGYQDKMLESNIWSMFPSLRNICLNTFSGKLKEYKRSDWVKVQSLNLP